MLRDPLDDNVLPVVEELQRRLPLPAIGLGEGEDDDHPVVNGTQNEMQTDEPIGVHFMNSLIIFLNLLLFFLFFVIVNLCIVDYYVFFCFLLSLMS